MVNFDQSVYSTDEDKGLVQLVLILSSPSITDITVRIFSVDGSATGKDLYYVLIQLYLLEGNCHLC